MRLRCAFSFLLWAVIWTVSSEAFPFRTALVRPTRKATRRRGEVIIHRLLEPSRGGSLNDDDPVDSALLPNITLSVDVETESLFEVLITETTDTKRLNYNWRDTKRLNYNWREFFPRPRAPMSVDDSKQQEQPKIKVPVFVERQIKIIRWFITGNTLHSKPSEEKNIQDLYALSRMLILLREYERKYGPSMLAQNVGGYGVQKQVLFNITKDLYSSGTPTWVLETVMSRVAEGMTGRAAEILLLPRRCFFYFPEEGGSGTQQLRRPATTGLFKISPGFYIAKLGAVEPVAVRLASFASNTGSVERINAEWLKMPSRSQLDTAKREAYRAYQFDMRENSLSDDPEAMAKEILNLASSTYGLFFYANSPEFQEVAKYADSAAPDEEDDFWQVTDSMRVLFSRLASTEASASLERIRQEEKQIYSPFMVSMFRMLSSAGACAMWFNGGFPDMLASAVLAVTVAQISTLYSKVQLAAEERMLVEVVSSFVVGVIAGMLSLRWPGTFCFGAIAVAAVMDIMQGFKDVYAIIEVMSKNIVTGTARLLEGIMFTGLISYSLKFGLDVAFRLFGKASSAGNYASMLECGSGINQAFFPLLLPLASVAWSGLFWPSRSNLPMMAFHGILAFFMNWIGAPMFVAAMSVTFSAGIISRFTGKEALGNTLAGLYALVPGAYMVGALLSPSRANFIETVLMSATTIGLGGWTGSLFCSPTILGKSSWTFRKKGEKKQPTMLYF